MGVDIRYSLPPHVSIDILNETVSRIIGSPLKYSGEGNKDLPASESNPWSTEVVNKYVNFAEGNKETSNVKDGKQKLMDYFSLNEDELSTYRDLGYFSIKIKAGELMGNHIVCEVSGDHYYNLGRGRAILPNSNIFWASIYTRVAEMFGGKLIYADSGDYDDPKNYFFVSNEKCLFSPAKKGESSDSIKYRYYNALKEVKSIDQDLINTLINKYGFSKDDERIGDLENLATLRFEEDLAREIPVNETILKTRTVKF